VTGRSAASISRADPAARRSAGTYLQRRGWRWVTSGTVVGMACPGCAETQ